MVKLKTPQKQFKGGYVPQEPIFPHGQDNREAGSPSKQRARNSVALGYQTAARPGLSGINARTKLSKPKARGR